MMTRGPPEGRGAFSAEVFEREADTLRAMAHPKRLMIVEMLGRRRESVSEIARNLEIPLPNVSQHLRVMRDRGIVQAERTGQTVRYRLTNPALRGCCAQIRRALRHGGTTRARGPH